MSKYAKNSLSIHTFLSKFIFPGLVMICLVQATKSTDSYQPSYIPLDRNKGITKLFILFDLTNSEFLPDYTVQFNENSKIPIRLPPTIPPGGTYNDQLTFDYDMEEHAVAVERTSNVESEFVHSLPNVRRHRRQNEKDEARLLSQSAFNRITETLGALNKVGSFFLNMTREVNGEHGHRDNMQLISSSSSSSSTKKPLTTENSTSTEKIVSNSVPILSNKVLGQNITKDGGQFIKRIGQQPGKEFKSDKQALNEKIDMAALAEKKRKKHQAATPTKESIALHTTVSTTISPGLH